MVKRTIPQIREEIHRITAALRLVPELGAHLLSLDDLDQLAEETRRRPNKPKPPPFDDGPGTEFLKGGGHEPVG